MEEITMDVISIGRHAIILGMPWLKHHNPDINWTKRKFNWQDQCQFHKEWSKVSKEYAIAACETSNSPADTEELEIMEMDTQEQAALESQIPSEYHDFLDVFDLEKARQLPPLRGEWDFTIDLKKGAVVKVRRFE